MKKNTSSDAQSISRIFDLQRFSPSDRLAKIISDVESRYGAAVSDDDLSLVSAAGEAVPAVPSDKSAGDDGEDRL